MFKKLLRRRKSEEGQSMLEFAIVLPIFLLLLAVVLDYGWLFYNSIGLENTARNAARVACVEYNDMCLTPEDAPYPGGKQEFELADLQKVGQASSDPLTEQEQNILKEVQATVPKSMKDVKVTVKFSYDEDYLKGVYTSFAPEKRYKGDVYILVSATHTAISPLVGFDRADGLDAMHRKVTSKAVYRVEKMGS